MGLGMSNKPACCCGERDDSIVQIGIGEETIGLVGLNGIFEQLHVLGRPPDSTVEDELLLMVAAQNYVAAQAEDEYRAALLREYARFCARKSGAVRR